MVDADIRPSDLDAMKNPSIKLYSGGKIMHPILGWLKKTSDELRSDLASDLSRDLIHPSLERSWML